MLSIMQMILIFINIIDTNVINNQMILICINIIGTNVINNVINNVISKHYTRIWIFPTLANMSIGDQSYTIIINEESLKNQ